MIHRWMLLVLGTACGWGGHGRSAETVRTLTPDELQHSRHTPGRILVDVRDSNLYNGWPSGDARRGGHIPGSLNLALTWLEQKPKGHQTAFERLGIKPTDQIVLIGEGPDDAERARVRLINDHGVPADRIMLMSQGFNAWAADPARPVDSLPRYDRLLSPAKLAEELKRRPEVKLFEVFWGDNGKGKDMERFRQRHIPGAVFFDSDLFEVGPIWNVVAPQELEKALLGLGITVDTPVVVYGPQMMPAARAAAVLMYAGVKDVRTLNGGFDAWVAAGLPTEKGEPKAKPAVAFGGKIPVRPEVITGIDNARRLLQGGDRVLVDVRSWREHIGEVTGYDDIKAKGRIPGAVWGRGGSDAMKFEDYRNPDGTLRCYPQIVQFWAESGITPDKTVGFHCGTGWRAAESYLAAWLMGWEKITIYDGGWYEWSADPKNPIETGVPKKPTESAPPKSPGTPNERAHSAAGGLSHRQIWLFVFIGVTAVWLVMIVSLLAKRRRK